MNDLGLVLFLAAAFESLAEYVYSLVESVLTKDWKTGTKAYLAVLVATGAVWTLKLDIFAVLGFTVPFTWLTVVLGGFALARGANFLHDLIGWTQNKYQASKEV